MLKKKVLLPESDRAPPSKYFGQEFIEDPDKRKIKILCIFPNSAVINEYHFSSDLFKASVYPEYPDLCLEVEREISKKLLDSVLENDRNYHFFISSIFPALGKMNDYLSEQMHLTGHLLIRTYSLHDLKQLFIVDPETGVKTEVPCPHLTAEFRPALSGAEKNDRIFIRDFIDSMNCYIEGNYDECIQKLVSSLDHAFTEYQIYGKAGSYSEAQLKDFSKLKNHAKTLQLSIRLEEGTFMDKLNEFINKGYWRTNWSTFFPIWISNIHFVYRLRNHLIHARLRLKSEDRIICDRGIATVWYIYQNNQIDPQIRRYLWYSYTEYRMLIHEYDGYDLDNLSGIFSYFKKRDNDKEKSYIDSREKMDEFTFKGLEIEETVQKHILKKYGIT